MESLDPLEFSPTLIFM